jgi:L-ribulose-5-phosphate 3-epimerase
VQYHFRCILGRTSEQPERFTIQSSYMLTRRRLLSHAASLFAWAALAPGYNLPALSKGRRFKFGACDWSLGKAGSTEAFTVAKAIGLDGIMVSMGTAANNLQLRQRVLQDEYLAAAKKTGVAISSLAIGEFNNTPYKSDPRTEEWLWDSIDTAAYLQAPVILLAFFNKNDLRNDEKGKQETIRRLKLAAPKAEKMGVILGIESYLDAADHLDIIEKVGSKNVQVYLDCRNTADAGFDVLKEIRLLGKDHICELHIKENGQLLGNGSMDWPAIAELLYKIGYYGDGWIQLEWAMPENASVEDSYRHNLGFLQQLFAKQV